MGISCGVLVFLYVFQYVGTNHLGWAFSPIIVAWLLFNTIIGIYNIAHWHPGKDQPPCLQVTPRAESLFQRKVKHTGTLCMKAQISERQPDTAIQCLLRWM